ncbi:MAG: hypothetical protein ABFD50_11980 [Smithella sp.]
MKLYLKLNILDDQGVAIIGKGSIHLLRNIQQQGSINKAAKEMDMSYVKALKIIRKMENCLGAKILKTTIGGKDYGGSELTPLAIKLLNLFTTYESKVENFANKQFIIFEKHLDAICEKEINSKINHGS